MAKGALRTFFRQDAGFEQDEPDLTDFLLDSMIGQGRRPRTDAFGSPAPYPTSAARASGMAAMAGMRGQQGLQGAPGPQQGPMRLPGALGQMQQQTMNINAKAYPGMPGPPPGAAPMPQMRQPGWADFLSQAGGGVADAMNARSGMRTNWFQQIQGQGQANRNQEFQLAMAERAAMENAARMAHEYDWRKYGAGRQEAKADSLAEQREEDVKFRDRLLAAQKEKEGWGARLQAAVLPGRFEKAETDEELDALIEKALLETQGDPALMEQVMKAAAVERKAMEWKKVGRKTWFSDVPGQKSPAFVPPSSYHPWMTPSAPQR